MRIVGEINHSKYKITIFHMNNKHSVQFEDGENTQLYKIPDLDQLKGINEIKRLIDGVFLEEVDQIFKQMKNLKVNHIRSFIEQSGREEFEHIV